MDDLHTFVRAVDAGSLSGAAKALDVPKSTVSRRLQRLEAELGQPLVQRSARAFRLTDAGKDLYDRSAPACHDLLEATRTVKDGSEAPIGRLRVAAPSDLGSMPSFVSLVCAFQRNVPSVRLELLLTNRLVDLVAEQVDFAFHVHGRQLKDRATLKVRRLLTMHAGLYASPGYLRTRHAPAHPRDLDRHTTFAPTVSLDQVLALRAADGTGPSYPVGSPVGTSSYAFVRTAVECGAGIGVLSTLDGALLVEQGRATPVLAEWSLPSATLSLVWPASRQMAARSRAFVAHAIAHCEVME